MASPCPVSTPMVHTSLTDSGVIERTSTYTPAGGPGGPEIYNSLESCAVPEGGQGVRTPHPVPEKSQKYRLS